MIRQPEKFSQKNPSNHTFCKSISQFVIPPDVAIPACLATPKAFSHACIMRRPPLVHSRGPVGSYLIPVSILPTNRPDRELTLCTAVVFVAMAGAIPVCSGKIIKYVPKDAEVFADNRRNYVNGRQRYLQGHQAPGRGGEYKTGPRQVSISQTLLMEDRELEKFTHQEDRKSNEEKKEREKTKKKIWTKKIS